MAFKGVLGIIELACIGRQVATLTFYEQVQSSEAGVSTFAVPEKGVTPDNQPTLFQVHLILITIHQS